MDVLKSLMTPGYFVRTRAGRHCVVVSFDQTHNLVSIAERAGVKPDIVHFEHLLAGNDETEQAILSTVSDRWPKCHPFAVGEEAALYARGGDRWFAQFWAGNTEARVVGKDPRLAMGYAGTDPARVEEKTARLAAGYKSGPGALLGYSRG